MEASKIKKYIYSYYSKVTALDRYASFDYCFNYFQSFKLKGRTDLIASNECIEMSVLQLSCYLASWGMYRGSTALLRHSSHCLIPVLNLISKLDSSYWDIDIDSYPVKMNNLKDLYLQIGTALKFPLIKPGDVIEQIATGTLVSKILLGVFGNSPAFDRAFTEGYRITDFANKDYAKCTNRIVQIWTEISEFYIANRKTLDSFKLRTLKFEGDNHEALIYPKAKIIDMFYFEQGNEAMLNSKLK